MHRGLLTTEFAMNSVAAVPALAPLVLFFKHVLRAADLHDSATGGLPSYAVLVIVRAYLESPAALAAAAQHGGSTLTPSPPAQAQAPSATRTSACSRLCLSRGMSHSRVMLPSTNAIW